MTEITVKVNGALDEVIRIFDAKNIILDKKVILNDIFITENDYAGEDPLVFLDECVLIRESSIRKTLVKKRKLYNSLGEITSQKKYECGIDSIEEAVSFMTSIGYKKLFDMKTQLYFYKVGEYTILIQEIEDLGIYIELETENIDGFREECDLINFIKSLNIPIETANYYAKKSLDMFYKINNKKI